MKIKTRTITLEAANDDAICESQTAASAGELMLDGVSAGQNLDCARRIAIVSNADDSGNTFTITGLARDGVTVISESITGPNEAPVYSNFDYLKVTSVSISSASVGTIKVGTCGKASSDWVPLDYHSNPFVVSLIVDLSAGASLNYTVEFTSDPILDSYERRYRVDPAKIKNHNDSNLVSATTAKEGNFAFPCSAVRVKTNSYNAGTVTLNVMQAGLG